MGAFSQRLVYSHRILLRHLAEDLDGAAGRGVVRVGLHPGVTESDVERFIVALHDAVAALVSGASR